MAKVKWLVDSTHSEIGFKVKHLMITNVSGSFGEFEVEAMTDDENFTTAQITVKIKTASVTTHNAQRDQHLRSGDFFDIEEYPDITFKSESLEPLDNDELALHGNLTIKGVTKPVTLNVEFGGTTKDPWGGRRAGFVITGKIKRNEFGLGFNTILDSGGLSLGEEVKVHSEIQMVKQQETVMETSGQN